MSSYRLNINFTEEALKVIYAAHQKLALTKAVAGNMGKAVVWVSTLPFARNTIEWKENYMLYSSMEEVQNGANIKKLSDTSAIDNVVYDFSSAIFQNAKSSDCVSANEYAVHNAMDQYGSQSKRADKRRKPYQCTDPSLQSYSGYVPYWEGENIPC